MKLRVISLGLFALASLTSGCMPYRQHPCWGFRLHPCANGGGQCAPVCSSPIRSMMSKHHRAPAIISDCATCIGGGAMPHHGVAFPVGGVPVNGFPSGGYPPVIGQPIPIPGGPGVIQSHELPNPMPVKPNGQ